MMDAQENKLPWTPWLPYKIGELDLYVLKVKPSRGLITSLVPEDEFSPNRANCSVLLKPPYAYVYPVDWNSWCGGGIFRTVRNYLDQFPNIKNIRNMNY